MENEFLIENGKVHFLIKSPNKPNYDRIMDIVRTQGDNVKVIYIKVQNIKELIDHLRRKSF